jgi:16S rRNA processing protein RimM
VATGLRLRGAGGRLTARLIAGGIDQLEGCSWVLIGHSGGKTTRFELEEHRLYKGKVILKLKGVDSAERASGLVGQDILIPCNRLVDLPEGAYYIFELVGMCVRTRDGRDLGRVEGVIETGGTPLLEVARAESDQRDGRREPILLPVARAICTNIDTAAGTITVDPPEGLLELYGI